VLININLKKLKNTLIQVLHGCRQSVSREVRLTPLTDEIPVINLNLIINGKDRFHLGRRQAVMALMIWAIDVPQELLQSEAKPFLYHLKPY
jgi:hypothetical protein